MAARSLATCCVEPTSSSLVTAHSIAGIAGITGLAVGNAVQYGFRTASVSVTPPFVAVQIGSLLQMWYLSRRHVKLTSTPSRHQQRQAAIERLLSQQRLEGAAGIRVRLTSQNQVFLDTWRPTRVAIPASLLAKIMPGFKIGRKAFIRATYGRSSIYHYYGGGQTWCLPSLGASENRMMCLK